MISIEQIAKTCHEVNKAYCDSIGDTSQVHWDEAPQWQKDSAIKGVQYSIDNKNTTPEMLHENWCNDKIKDGWTYGTTKDPEKKTHPQLIPYHLLPEEQKIKDYLFRGVVNSMI